MQFREWLMTENNARINKINIFDFDDTLVYTPTPNQANKLIERYNIVAKSLNKPTLEPIKTNRYWYNIKSLEPPIIADPAPIRLLNTETASKFYESVRNPGSLTIIMTGRPPKLKKALERILKDYNLKPDRLYMMPEVGSNLQQKKKHLKEILDEFKHVKEIEMWEDRGPKKAKLSGKPEHNHVSEFRKFLQAIKDRRCFGDKTYDFKFKVNEVPPREEVALELMQKNPKCKMKYNPKKKRYL